MVEFDPPPKFVYVFEKSSVPRWLTVRGILNMLLLFNVIPAQCNCYVFIDWKGLYYHYSLVPNICIPNLTFPGELWFSYLKCNSTFENIHIQNCLPKLHRECVQFLLLMLKHNLKKFLSNISWFYIKISLPFFFFFRVSDNFLHLFGVLAIFSIFFLSFALFVRQTRAKILFESIVMGLWTVKTSKKVWKHNELVYMHLHQQIKLWKNKIIWARFLVSQME